MLFCLGIIDNLNNFCLEECDRACFLVIIVDDISDTFILDKLIPGPLHLYLSLNEVLNYCEKNCLPELKAVLLTVSGAKVHVYMGKIGNYEGPNIRKIFQKLETLKRYMTNVKELYHNVLVPFKQVSESVFLTELHPSWREHLHHHHYLLVLRACY